MLADLVKLSRPHHWLKNVFVLMPAPFALASGAELDALRFGLGLGGFCLANSAIYSLNDARDAERDRLHEEKRNRPVASGRISVPVAQGWGVFLIVLAGLLCFLSGSMNALLIASIYLVTNLFYTFVGKNIPLVDVFLLSSFFLMRVLLGCALLDVVASNWLLLCSGALALFMGLTKRRADVVRGLDGNQVIR